LPSFCFWGRGRRGCGHEMRGQHGEDTNGILGKEEGSLVKLTFFAFVRRPGGIDFRFFLKECDTGRRLRIVFRNGLRGRPLRCDVFISGIDAGCAVVSVGK